MIRHQCEGVYDYVLGEVKEFFDLLEENHSLNDEFQCYSSKEYTPWTFVNDYEDISDCLGDTGKREHVT